MIMIMIIMISFETHAAQVPEDLKLRPEGERLTAGDPRMGEAKCAELLCVLASQPDRPTTSPNPL